MNATSLWHSWFRNEKKWAGKWKRCSGCTYSEFTDVELQQCIDKRKLYGFNVEGKSIAEMIQGYINQRLRNISLYNNTEFDDGTIVTISTFKLLHYCYFPEEVTTLFQNMPNVSENQEFFWVNPMFLSSERETICFNSQLIKYSAMGKNCLTPKGYKMINAYDMSAAMTYDTAAQKDGMHINGPSMRMILTKILHFL